MNEHTPGPWHADSFLGSDSYEDPDLPFVEIGDVKWSPNKTSVPSALQQYTDAHLIAAAPELLEELESRYVDAKCGCGHPACKRCRDDQETERIINKAKGETNHE